MIINTAKIETMIITGNLNELPEALSRIQLANWTEQGGALISGPEGLEFRYTASRYSFGTPENTNQHENDFDRPRAELSQHLESLMCRLNAALEPQPQPATKEGQ